MSFTISRMQLYERVWRQPVTQVAKEFGISDVGLRKTCKRHRIPTPPVGYWAKLAHGKRVAIAPLPDPSDNDVIRIWAGGSGSEPEDIANARAAALTAIPAMPLLSQHPSIDRTMAKLRNSKPGRDGLVRSSGSKLIGLAMRPETLNRAEVLLRQLVGAGEAAGLALVPGEEDMEWQCAGERIAFELVEAADQIEHVETEKELRAHAKWQRDREDYNRRYGYWRNWDEPKIPKWDQHYNGRIAVRLEKVRVRSEQDPWGKGIRSTFADSRTHDVSRAIPSIVATIAAMAAAKRSNAAYEERRRVADELARKQWEEKERRRVEWDRAGKLAEDLIDLDQKARGLGQLLDRLRASGSLKPRSDRFMHLLEARLANLVEQLGADALERRLLTMHLFDEV